MILSGMGGINMYNFIKIVLEDGQTGYDIVGKYVERYFKHNGYRDVLVSLGYSYDNSDFDYTNEICSPEEDDIEFLSDWWEGQTYITIFGIQPISDIDVKMFDSISDSYMFN